MAVVPLCYKIPFKEQVLPLPKSSRNHMQEFKYGNITLTEHSKHFGSALNNTYNRWHSLYPAADNLKNTKTKVLMKASGGAICSRGLFPIQNVDILWRMSFSKRSTTSTKENLCIVCYASESSTSKGQLRLLESYFAKNHNDANQICSDSPNKMTEVLDKRNANKAKKGLDSLDAYLGKLEKDSNVTSDYDNQSPENNLIVTSISVSKTSKRSESWKLKGYRKLRQKDRGNEDLQQNEMADLYLINTLASVNIAVFLFDIASPIRNSDVELFSIPSLYGAKINNLILIGEWWRLVTPMFLHSGVLHVALGCWALLTFGPQVCKSYGSFTFFLIYTLGGISGNLTSFLHTPEPSVGGTGPVFAIIGAWLVYQIQNKNVIARNHSESMFQKALITTAFGCMMSNFGLVDNWTHFGAAFTGIIYGFLTCPVVQVDDTSSRSQEKRITFVGKSADPCKSLFLFAVFIVVLSSLLFVFEPPLF